MSIRIQKGCTVFKPVARSRARPSSESRQSSVLPDAQSFARHDVNSSGEISILSFTTDMDMPPPAHVPLRSAPSTSTRPAGEPQSSNSPPDTESTTRESISSSSSSTHTRLQALQGDNNVVSDIAQQQISTSAGNAITAPSKVVPIVVSHPRRLSSIGGASAEESQSSDIPSSRPAHVLATLPVISFNLNQIDPSLQPIRAEMPAHAHAQPSLVGTGRCDNDDEIAGSGWPPQTALSSAEEGTSAEGAVGTEAGSSRTRGKRRRAATSQEAVDVDLSPNGAPRKRRSKRRSQDEAGEEGDSSQAETNTRKRRGRTRAPSLPPYDDTTGPGEELDPTVVTMSVLCDDTGHGRVSSKAAQIISNHAVWRVTSKGKRARLRAIAEARKYGRNIEEEEPSSQSTNTIDPTSSQAPTSAGVALSPSQDDPGTAAADNGHPSEEEQTAVDFDYTQNLATSRYNVQVRIGANGETIIDEESLFVNRDEEDDTANYTHVEESDTTKFINSLTYSKKPRGSRWSAEETELFFDALSQFGENYELISYILPGRDRKACKNKFKAEDRKNPARINFCLNHRKPFDVQTLARMTGKDFSGPVPIIKAPTPLQSTQLDSAESENPLVPRKKSRTPAPQNGGEEIVGNIDDVDNDDKLFDSTNPIV